MTSRAPRARPSSAPAPRSPARQSSPRLVLYAAASICHPSTVAKVMSRSTSVFGTPTPPVEKVSWRSNHDPSANCAQSEGGGTRAPADVPRTKRIRAILRQRDRVVLPDHEGHQAAVHEQLEASHLVVVARIVGPIHQASELPPWPPAVSCPSDPGTRAGATPTGRGRCPLSTSQSSCSLVMVSPSVEPVGEHLGLGQLRRRGRAWRLSLAKPGSRAESGPEPR